MDKDVERLAMEAAAQLNMSLDQYIQTAVLEKIDGGKKTSFPEKTFTITPDMAEWFQKQSFNIDMVEATTIWVQKMISNKRKYRYVNWSRTWQTAMRNQNKWDNNKKKPLKNGASHDMGGSRFFGG